MEVAWAHFMTTWKGETAQRLLSGSALPLPTTGYFNVLAGSFSELGARIRMHPMDPAAALPALKLGAVGRLAEIQAWLQQHPCQDLHSFPPSSKVRPLWYRVTSVLQAVAAATVETQDPEHNKQCGEVLAQTEGNCFGWLGPQNLLPVGPFKLRGPDFRVSITLIRCSCCDVLGRHNSRFYA